MVKTELAHLHTATRSRCDAWARACRSDGWRNRRTWVDACASLAPPLASQISGATLLLHGGGERPAFLDAVDEK